MTRDTGLQRADIVFCPSSAIARRLLLHDNDGTAISTGVPFEGENRLEGADVTDSRATGYSGATTLDCTSEAPARQYPTIRARRRMARRRLCRSGYALCDEALSSVFRYLQKAAAVFIWTKKQDAPLTAFNVLGSMLDEKEKEPRSTYPGILGLLVAVPFRPGLTKRRCNGKQHNPWAREGVRAA
jgi:hypothetical protein